MSIKSLADDAVRQIADTIGGELNEQQTRAIAKIVEGKLIEAVKHSTRNYTSATASACGAESDLAHKIAREVQLAQEALIANLKSMR